MTTVRRLTYEERCALAEQARIPEKFLSGMKVTRKPSGAVHIYYAFLKGRHAHAIIGPYGDVEFHRRPGQDYGEHYRPGEHRRIRRQQRKRR
jgi:hypothetical protein